MVRKLAAAMLSAGFLIPGLANALGLGEIKLNSALSEPLDAEIELVQVRELTPQEIVPSLANVNDFEAANVERFHFLTDLRFSVETGDNGKPVVRVRSRRPVQEPFLNFLVEVNWPAGRLLREYTILLDPPLYKEKKAAAVTPAGRTSVPATSQLSTQPTEPRSSSGAQPTSSGGATSSRSSADTYIIQANDSLWKLASRFKPSSQVSVQQTMIAMQRNNPDAFIDNNINLLIKGEVLRIPTEDDVLQATSREAIAIVAEQNRQWRDRSKPASTATSPQPRQLDLAGDTGSATEDAGEEEEGARLTLVSEQVTGNDVSAQGGAGGSGNLRDQLAVTEENLDKARLENEDLGAKVTELETQLQTSQKVLSLKNEEIAALQARLAALENQMGQQGGQQTDYNFAEEPAANTPQPDGTPKETATPATVSTPETTTPQGSTPESTDDGKSGFFKNPLYWAAAAIFGLLILLLALFNRKKNQSETLFEESQENPELIPEAHPGESLAELSSVNLEEDDAFEEAVEASVIDTTIPREVNVLNEADVYIAYGRYPQAMELLQQAIEAEPNRADYRLKMCEVCAEAQNPQEFNEHYNQLALLGDSSAMEKADEFRGKLDFSELDGLGQFESGEFESSEFGGEGMDDTQILATPGSFIADDEPAEERQESDLDLGDLGAELNQETDTGLDFDLGDLEDTTRHFEESNEEQALDDGNGLDFELDLDPSSDQEDQPLEEQSLDIANDLDFESPLAGGEDSQADVPDAVADLGDELVQDSNLEDAADNLSLDSDFLGETVEQDEILGEADDSLASGPETDSNDQSTGNVAAIGAGLAAGVAGFVASSDETPIDELDFIKDGDESSTKLDLARAYIDMGDREGAKDILDEVMVEGNDDQKTEAKDLLVRLET